MVELTEEEEDKENQDPIVIINTFMFRATTDQESPRGDPCRQEHIQQGGSLPQQNTVQANKAPYAGAPVDPDAACYVCHSGDNDSELLVCDGCNCMVHCGCNPVALDRVPEGSFFCQKCRPLGYDGKERGQLSEENSKMKSSSDSESDNDEVGEGSADSEGSLGVDRHGTSGGGTSATKISMRKQEDPRLTPISRSGRATKQSAVKNTLVSSSRTGAPHIDIWTDEKAIAFLKTGEAEDAAEVKRLRKKLKLYTWEKEKMVVRYSNRIVPEPSRREKMIIEAHALGHRGYRSVLEMLTTHSTWAGMQKQVQEVCSRCENCKEKGLKPIVDPVLRPLPLPDFLSRGAMDMFGPLPVSKYGNARVVVYIDYYSKYVTAAAVPDKASETIRKFLRERIICDGQAT